EPPDRVRSALRLGGHERPGTARRLDQLGAHSHLPGDVRYELDLSKLQNDDVTWDKSTRTLRIQLTELELAGPDVDINSVKEYGGAGVLSALTNANQQLDQANRDRAVQDLRKQAT